jgi:hypothetical protein
MKYFAAAALALWGAGALAAPPQPVHSPAPPPPDLRQMLQQYQVTSTSTTAPRQMTEARQLTDAERAELRRQLSEYAQPVAPRHR